jgi:hypothetical protein
LLVSTVRIEVPLAFANFIAVVELLPGFNTHEPVVEEMSVTSCAVPPAVKVSAVVPVIEPVEVPVPPSDTARSVMPVIVPPEMETLLDACVDIVPRPVIWVFAIVTASLPADPWLEACAEGANVDGIDARSV